MANRVAMLTSLSRSRCATACGALLALACSVDDRTLSASGVADAGAPSGGVPGEQPEQPSCVGEPGERRCHVPGGSFQLGPENARVPANVSDFELDELEVTVARFRKYAASFSGAPTADAGQHPEVAGSGWRSEWDPFLPASKEQLLASLHCNFDWQTWSDEPGEREAFPLTCASYYVAFAFCAWDGGRLPTEAEWEYAAAGGAEQRAYPWGDSAPSPDLALFAAPKIAAAGGHRSGMARFGQLDLAGSAWEWTLDFFHRYPTTCDRCAEVDAGPDRVLRGGAFLYDAEYLKAAYRYHSDPQLTLGEVGFRCAYAP